MEYVSHRHIHGGYSLVLTIEEEGFDLVFLLTDEGMSHHYSEECIEQCFKSGFDGKLERFERAIESINRIIDNSLNLPMELQERLVSFRDSWAKSSPKETSKKIAL